MGSLYAAFFAQAGYETWAIDVWSEHVETINEKGLLIEGASGNRLVKGVQAATSVAEAAICDIYIIATKSLGVEAAAKAVSFVMPPDALVLSIQNGLGTEEKITKYVPKKNVSIGLDEPRCASMRPR